MYVTQDHTEQKGGQSYHHASNKIERSNCSSWESIVEEANVEGTSAPGGDGISAWVVCETVYSVTLSTGANSGMAGHSRESDQDNARVVTDCSPDDQHEQESWTTTEGVWLEGVEEFNWVSNDTATYCVGGVQSTNSCSLANGEHSVIHSVDGTTPLMLIGLIGHSTLVGGFTSDLNVETSSTMFTNLQLTLLKSTAAGVDVEAEAISELCCVECDEEVDAMPDGDYPTYSRAGDWTWACWVDVCVQTSWSDCTSPSQTSCKKTMQKRGEVTKEK